MAIKKVKFKNNNAKYMKTSLSYKVGQTINYTLLLFLGLITLYPFWYSLILAFNDGKDALAGGVYFWPRAFTLDNFVKAFRNKLIFSAFGITVARTLISIVLGCFFTGLLAYAMTKHDLPGRSWLIFFFYFTTLFSGGLIPLYVTFRQLGLINNFWVYVLPGIYNFFNAIILRTFFYSIPDSLHESARIDGCSEFGIFFRIMLPLSLPAVATIALFIGVANWNDWFTGAYFVPSNADIHPAATLLNKLLSQASFESAIDATSGQGNVNEELMLSLTTNTTPESLKMAFLIILTTPIMCVYPFLQKYFVKGVMLGSIKA